MRSDSLTHDVENQDLSWIRSLMPNVSAENPRILYIHGTRVPPPTDCRQDRFYLLSSELQGHVIQPIWFTEPSQVEERFGSGSFPEYHTGRFTYHWLLNPAKGASGWWRRIRFTFSTALSLNRKQPIDCIVAYSHFLPALCGIVIKWLTGARLITEIATSPDLLHLTNRPNPSLKDKLRHHFSNLCLHLAVLFSDQTHVLAPDTLISYKKLRTAPQSVFHDFVPTLSVPRQEKKKDLTILLVGAPWYLKGVDLLISAFLNMQADYPSAKLQLLGHYPELETVNESFRSNPGIEVLKSRSHPETLELISRASVLVLPSRCEGMGRVLLEAMAAGIPVVGSRVGGIPHIIRDGETGFLFPANDSAALEDRLRRLLGDEALRTKMGEAGYRLVCEEFSEERYVSQFSGMVRAAIEGTR